MLVNFSDLSMRDLRHLLTAHLIGINRATSWFSFANNHHCVFSQWHSTSTINSSSLQLVFTFHLFAQPTYYFFYLRQYAVRTLSEEINNLNATRHWFRVSSKHQTKIFVQISLYFTWFSDIYLGSYYLFTSCHRPNAVDYYHPKSLMLLS